MIERCGFLSACCNNDRKEWVFNLINTKRRSFRICTMASVVNSFLLRGSENLVPKKNQIFSKFVVRPEIVPIAACVRWI
jgi:hypothetical protein